MLLLKEPIKGEQTYRHLRIVPKDLYNIIFIAFHANPIGGHFGLSQTIIRIRMRFFWPGMYKYCKDMISKCAGCKLANADIHPSRDLVYNFPIDGPMTVLHVDGYQVGAEINFAGDRIFLVACCGMCTFAAVEPVAKADSTHFA